MGDEMNATLLHAYRKAIETGQTEIADDLEKVVLEKMNTVKKATMRDMKASNILGGRPVPTISPYPTERTGVTYTGIEPGTKRTTAEVSE